VYAWLGNAATQKTPIPCGEGLVHPVSNCGDNIDWGQLYLAGNAVVNVGAAAGFRTFFGSSGKLGPRADSSPMLASENPVLATVVEASTEATYVVFGYDQDVAIRWWGKDFKGLWTREAPTMAEMLEISVMDAARVNAMCKAFDDAEIDKYFKVGGAKFATILSLAYRQSYSSTKLTWNSGGAACKGCKPVKPTHWQFLKEISTGSDLSTMDVIYPGSPLYIYQAVRTMLMLVLLLLVVVLVLRLMLLMLMLLLLVLTSLLHRSPNLPTTCSSPPSST